MKELLQYLPAALGMFVVITSAGFLGLFKSFMVAKQSNNEAISSLEKLLEIKQKEIDTYSKQIETYQEQIKHYKEIVDKY
jgi:peptidoglycan hydrolase CwlO-like protein